MAELTDQDRSNYENFKNAASSLKNALNSLPATTNSKLLKELFSAIVHQLPVSLKDIGELRKSPDQIESYMVVQSLLLDISSLNAEQKLAVANTTQELISQSNLIKESLQDITDTDLSALDDLGSPCIDAQFLDLIPDHKIDLPKTWTKRLLAGYSFELSSTEITKLTDAWGIAIDRIVEDAQDQALSLTPGTPDTIVRFFCIHEELEDLYDKVSNLVA